MDMLLYLGGSSDVLWESVLFTGRIRTGWRLSGSTGRLFSRPCCIPGNISVSCRQLSILIAVVYILAYYVIEWMQEMCKVAPDG